MAMVKTENAIFRDDFAILLEKLGYSFKKLPKDPPKSRFL
jgi:hypothetical protein